MHLKRMKCMQECLIAKIEAYMANLEQADTEELGEALDMVKDLSEAIYYSTITKAMEEPTQSGTDPAMAYYRDMDRHGGRMYYSDNMHTEHGASNGRYYSDSSYGSSGGNPRNFSSGSSQGGGHSTSYSSPSYSNSRDMREGRSPMSRKNYMESKEMGHDKTTQVKELEKYISELTTDITEMIEGASQEEKQLLQRKISTLATKIV